MKAELLQERLLARGKDGRFGHFYLFQGRAHDEDKQKEWVLTLIRRYWKEIEKRSTLPADLRGDADLLWLAPPRDENKTSDYRLEDFEALWRFLPYKGLAARRRFVVVEEAQRVGTVVANKLLKTLEEPEGELSFLWLNPAGQKLLPTIESRAVALPLSWHGGITPPSEGFQELRGRFAQGYALAEFLEDGKQGVFSASEVLEDFLAHEQREEGPAALKQELLDLVRQWREAEQFHQPLAVRLQGLHTLLSQRFRENR